MNSWWTVTMKQNEFLVDSADYEAKTPALSCARYWAKYCGAKRLKRRNTWRSWDGSWEVKLSVDRNGDLPDDDTDVLDEQNANYERDTAGGYVERDNG